MLWRTPLSFFTSNRSSPSLSVASPATYLLCVRILASVLTVLTRLGPPFLLLLPPHSFFLLSYICKSIRILQSRRTSSLSFTPLPPSPSMIFVFDAPLVCVLWTNNRDPFLFLV